MRATHLLLWSIARLVPALHRDRWLEEWRREVQHGGIRMLSGAVPDAWAVRRLYPTPDRLSVRLERIVRGTPQDIRFSLRGLIKAPGFTFAAIASLSLGIGASAGTFTLINALFLSPFQGVLKQDELVQLTFFPPERRLLDSSTYADFQRLSGGLTTLSGLSALHSVRLIIAADRQAIETAGALVSRNYLDLLGVRPARGRFFVADETEVPLARPAAVISHGLWQGRFAGAEDTVGRTVLINGMEVRIVGVAPEGFSGTRWSSGTTVWIPFALSELVLTRKDGSPVHISQAGPLPLHYVGRLKPGASVEQTHAEAQVLASTLTPSSRGAARRIWALPERRSDPAREGPRMVAFMALPLLVLVIACVNAANLLLARAGRRRVELAVRLALGASRWRVIRQILVECLVLGIAASVAGLAVSYWLLQLREHFLPIALAADVMIDVRVLGFTIVLAIVTAVLFGLGPALSATRNASVRAPFDVLRGGRLRVTLVALQAALSLAVLGTGVQFVRTVQGQTGIDDFPDPERHLVAAFDLTKLRFSELQAAQFFDEVLRRARGLAEVEAVGGISFDLLSGFNGVDSLMRIWLPGDAPAQPRDSLGGFATGGVFKAVGLRLLAGRTFTEADVASRPSVAVADETFAQQLFGGNAVGQRFRVGRARDEFDASLEVTVVGIVQSRRERLPIVFLPVRLGSAQSLRLHLQTRADAAAAADDLRRIVGEVDGRVPIASLLTARETWRLQNAFDDMIAGSVTALGIMALLLASGGLYAVVSFLVAMREKEIGIRMSLGATSTSVVRMIVTQALGPSAIGCLVGAASAIAAGQLVRSRLYGASPVDLVAMGGSAVLMLAVLLLASAIPARRAARVDPIAVLRSE